jgi:hypothetical protein
LIKGRDKFAFNIYIGKFKTRWSVRATNDEEKTKSHFLAAQPIRQHHILIVFKSTLKLEAAYSSENLVE